MQCTHYTETVEWETDDCGDRIKRISTERCREQAAGQLTHPDGTRNPGGFYCGRHAAATISEYLAKLGERWGLTDIPGERPTRAFDPLATRCLGCGWCETCKGREARHAAAEAAIKQRIADVLAQADAQVAAWKAEGQTRETLAEQLERMLGGSQ